jgi:hypothetical protein
MPSSRHRDLRTLGQNASPTGRFPHGAVRSPGPRSRRRPGTWWRGATGPAPSTSQSTIIHLDTMSNTRTANLRHKWPAEAVCTRRRSPWPAQRSRGGIKPRSFNPRVQVRCPGAHVALFEFLLVRRVVGEVGRHERLPLLWVITHPRGNRWCPVRVAVHCRCSAGCQRRPAFIGSSACAI